MTLYRAFGPPPGVDWDRPDLMIEAGDVVEEVPNECNCCPLPHDGWGGHRSAKVGDLHRVIATAWTTCGHYVLELNSDPEHHYCSGAFRRLEKGVDIFSLAEVKRADKEAEKEKELVQ